MRPIWLETLPVSLVVTRNNVQDNHVFANVNDVPEADPDGGEHSPVYCRIILLWHIT